MVGGSGSPELVDCCSHPVSPTTQGNNDQSESQCFAPAGIYSEGLHNQLSGEAFFLHCGIIILLLYKFLTEIGHWVVLAVRVKSAED